MRLCLGYVCKGMLIVTQFLRQTKRSKAGREGIKVLLITAQSTLSCRFSTAVTQVRIVNVAIDAVDRFSVYIVTVSLLGEICVFNHNTVIGRKHVLNAVVSPTTEICQTHLKIAAM